MLRWVYCFNGKNLPPEFSTRICCFKPKSGDDRIILEACTLIPDLKSSSFEETFSPLNYIWVIKGDVKKAQVYPWAWLKIETDVDPSFFTELSAKEFIAFVPQRKPDHLSMEFAGSAEPPIFS